MKQPKVLSGTPQALQETPLGLPQHISSFLSRYTLLNNGNCSGAPAHIALHLIKGLAEGPSPYVHAHFHPSSDEIGLVIGQPGDLEYEVLLNGSAHTVRSPGCIFIPAGTVHRARALRGNGAYVCMLMDPQGPTPANSVRADP
jgi:mannose-6-phosphate isomerase-like protein (cupin superfamily)